MTNERFTLYRAHNYREISFYENVLSDQPVSRSDQSADWLVRATDWKELLI